MEEKAKFQHSINHTKTVLVDFYTDWCGPCQAMSPILKEVAETFGEELCIVKLKANEYPLMIAKYEISTLPAFLLFNKGVLQWRYTGMVSAYHLEQVINKILKPTCHITVIMKEQD